MSNAEETTALPEIFPVTLAREAAVRLGPLTIEPALRRVRHDDGGETTIQPRVMQVLVALVHAQERILTRYDLTLSCWNGVVVGEDAINRVIGQLRRLSEGVGRGCFSVETIIRVGYRLLAHRVPTEVEPTRRPIDDRPVLAVLAFDNLCEAGDMGWFSDGVSEEIQQTVARARDLRVIGRASSFQFRGADKAAAHVAAVLKVTHVLDGSVRRSGQHIRVSAQLIECAGQTSLWSDRFDREISDIFAVQDEISTSIVAALRVNLLPEEKQAMERRGTNNLDAYHLYLQARQTYVSGNKDDPLRDEAIIRLCRRATEIDPNYASAWALMALTQAWSHDYHERSADDGLAVAEHALSLDPHLADAHTAKAKYFAKQGRHDEAFAGIDAALRLDGESYEANETAGMLSYRQNRMEDAIRYFERATTLLESGYFAPGMLTCCYGAVGDSKSARRAALTTVAKAEKALERDATNGGALGFLVIALGALGEVERARDRIDRALLMDPNNYPMRYNFACALCGLQDTDAALELLGPFFETTSIGFLSHAKADPDLEILRGDPRFTAMYAAAELRLAASDEIWPQRQTVYEYSPG